MKRLLLVLLVACKSSGKAPPPPPPAPETGSGSAGSANVSVAAEPPELDLCDAYDRGAVVAIFGWKGMQKIGGTGLSRGERHERHCTYRSLDDQLKDATFGLSFSTEVAFMTRHPGFEIDYRKREPVEGMEAWIGRNKEMVSLQVVTRGVRIMTTVARSGTLDEMEPKLVAATKKLVASLPAVDLLPLMHK
jgi:hypothetical protein